MDMLMERCQILSISAWNLTNESTGEVMRGSTIKIVDPTPVRNDTMTGCKISKMTGSLDLFHKFSGHKFPGLYNVVCSQKFSTDGIKLGFVDLIPCEGK